MSVHSLSSKKAGIIISNASNNGSIGSDEILELAHHIRDCHNAADSPGRKVASYVLWRVLLSSHSQYDGEPMTAESSAKSVGLLQAAEKLLNFLQGNIELTSDEIIILTEALLTLQNK